MGCVALLLPALVCHLCYIIGRDTFPLERPSLGLKLDAMLVLNIVSFFWDSWVDFYFLFFILYFFKTLLILLLRERWREEERGRETREISTYERYIKWLPLSCPLTRDLAGHVPWPGLEPVTSGSQASAQSTESPQPEQLLGQFLNFNVTRELLALVLLMSSHL